MSYLEKKWLYHQNDIDFKHTSINRKYKFLKLVRCFIGQI